MKTIIVPTDFSYAAKKAARYAMYIAKQIRANVMLCNAILIPAEVPMAGTVVWPLEDHDSLKQSAEHELHVLANKLKQREEETSPNAFHPAMSTRCEVGQAPNVIRNVFAECRATLSIMGMSGAGNISRFFLGSNSKELIETTTFPLILVPSGHIFTDITKIAFATDLSDGDIDVINSIASFAKYFNAEVLVAYVTDGLDDEKASQKKFSNFLSEISEKANYSNIYYRHIVKPYVDEGLEWLTEHGRVDMLAMVHRKHNAWYRIFQGSYTQSMAKKVDIPLMVYPVNCHPVI